MYAKAVIFFLDSPGFGYLRDVTRPSWGALKINLDSWPKNNPFPVYRKVRHSDNYEEVEKAVGKASAAKFGLAKATCGLPDVNGGFFLSESGLYLSTPKSGSA